MTPPEGSTRERILFLIKTRGPQTAQNLADRLELTPVAVRQHLVQLHEGGLVDFDQEPQGVGRPARMWRLTEAGGQRFPEGYADLALEILDGVRASFGREGLDKLVAARTRSQTANYRSEMPKFETPLAKRIAALVRIRSREGYMAEWRKGRDGTFTLLENHCPICAAARVCQGLCGAEQKLFEELLGPNVEIERTEHILAGSRRCAYTIRPRGSAAG